MHEHLSPDEFKMLVGDVLAPLLAEHGFQLSACRITNIWQHAEFTGHGWVVSLDYELPMHYADIRVETNPDGGLGSYDDPTKTYTISRLTQRLMPGVTQEEIRENSQYFSRFQPAGSEAKRVLAMVKSLRLVLPKFLAERSAS